MFSRKNIIGIPLAARLALEQESTRYLGIGRIFFLFIKTLSGLSHFLIAFHLFLRVTCNNCINIKQCVYLQITI